MIGAYALVTYVLRALRLKEVAMSEVVAFVKEVCELTHSLDAKELLLLEAFPSAARVRELPDLLQRQFDADGIDPEEYFLGDTLATEYAVGRVVERVVERRREKKKQAEEEGTARLDLALPDLEAIERLLVERGKIILLRMYRQIQRYRSFALLKIQSFIKDPNGLEIRQRRMKGISELGLRSSGSVRSPISTMCASAARR